MSNVSSSSTTSLDAESVNKETSVVGFRRHLNSVGRLLLQQWFLVALGILIAISSQVQVPVSQQAIKETVVTYLCVSVIFFITGCTLPTRVLLDNYSRWKLHLFVQLQCFLMTSAIAFGIVSATASNPKFMNPAVLVGILFTGCVPTTISSNVVMTKQANGNTALTTVQSTIGNFLGPFITPLLVDLYTSRGTWYTTFLPSQRGGYNEIYQRVFKQLGLSIFLPMFIGQLVQNASPKLTAKIFSNPKCPVQKLSSIALLIIIWQTYDQAFSTGALTSLPASNTIFLVFISIAYFLLWLVIAFFSSRVLDMAREDTVSVCYCVPAKTPAMGVPLVRVLFLGLSPSEQSLIQVPMVIFQGLQIAGGSLLIPAFKAWVEGGKLSAEKGDKEAVSMEGTPRDGEEEGPNQLEGTF